MGKLEERKKLLKTLNKLFKSPININTEIFFEDNGKNNC
jgi:hypothetical protein